MITVYKLTDADMFTRRGMAGETLWRVGVPSPVLDGNTLCRAGIWHAYEHPLTAAFMDIVHADLGLNARLWRAHAPAIVTRDDCLKCGVSQLTLVEELPLPVISTAARVRAAIEAALSVYNESGFVAWASAWLSGEDRSALAARTARAAARAATRAAWEAAKRLAARYGWGGRWFGGANADGKGYTFVCVDSTDADFEVVGD
jgi:hypothetical protein